MGYYDQADPIEATREVECDQIPGEEHGNTKPCGHIAEYDVQADRSGYFEVVCTKCGLTNAREDETIVHPEPDEDWGRGR